MEDSLSVKSNDSATTSDEFEFVNGSASGKTTEKSVSNLTCVSKDLRKNNHQQPLLDISNGSIEDLKKCLGEVLSEDNFVSQGKLAPSIKKMDENPE